MGDQPRFYRREEDWIVIVERLKQTACPHCKTVGTLIRHGVLTGFDDRTPGATSSGRGGSFAATAIGAAGADGPSASGSPTRSGA